MRQPVFTLVTLFSLSAALFLVGCSPVAWAPRETPHLSSIDLGRSVTLQLRDGSVLSGTYEAVRELSAEEYERYYAANIGSFADGSSLPQIGQGVLFTTSLDENKVWAGTLLGFDESSILVSRPDDSAVDKVYFSSVGSLVSKDGKPIRRMALRGLYLNGEIPLKSALVIRTTVEERQVPLNEIERIRLSPAADAGGRAAWLDARTVSWSRH